MADQRKKIFLTADWNDLLFLSFKVPDQVLTPYLPPGTVLDRVDGSAVASLVAFQFLNASFRGIRAPFFASFAELNLRFYVKEKSTQTPGVVFIREICPYRPVALAADFFFKEKFLVHRCEFCKLSNYLSYSFGKNENRGDVVAEITEEAPNPDAPLPPDFLVRRFHGFSKWNDSSLLHYEVDHEWWNLRRAKLRELNFPVEKWYPNDLANALRGEPMSVIYSPGSSVSLSWGTVSNVATGRVQSPVWNLPSRA